MLDPLTAIGLASSIVAFVDYGTKLVKGTIEIYDAADGSLTENRSREAVAVAMKAFAAQLISPEYSMLPTQEKELCSLAKECRAVCEKLIVLLERVKPKDTKSKRQSLWASLKTVYYKNECEDLETRLDTCRRQLEMHMSFKAIISIESLSDYIGQNTERIKLLEAAVSNLSSTGKDVQASAHELLDIQKRAFHATICNRILASLEFDGMNDRQGMVEKAHEKTFQWIFDDSASDHSIDSADTGLGDFDKDRKAIRRTREEYKMKQETREQFLTWLSSGRGLFHISGKMGCGKSTLMKFLSNHPQTYVQLEKWANGNELVFASFFFWQPGSVLQKSSIGLYRSLLYRVLELHSELMPSVFPRVWARIQERGKAWEGETKLDIQDEEIKRAFELLISNKDVCSKHSFCFFIDGLDEYQVKAQEDHADLARRLKSWTTKFSSNVKLCVSSREENAFINTFSSTQRLRLHTITQYDIKAYINARLVHSQEKKGIRALIELILQKANGIFFWVALVVRDIREQLDNGVEPDHLAEIVSGLPDELHDLYWRILQGFNSYSRKRAHQTLAIMFYAGGEETFLSLSLLSYSFLDDYNQNSKFARGSDFDARISELQAQRIEREANARMKLNGWCRGLVEADDKGDIHYAHRSVSDFVADQNVHEKIMTSLNGTHPVSILSELTLARVKIPGHQISFNDDYLAHGIAYLRQQHCLDQAPFDLLRSMDTTMEPMFKSLCDPSFDCSISIGSRGMALVVSYAGKNAYATREFAERSSIPLCYSPYLFLSLGLSEHVLWRIENDPKTTDTTSKAVLLFYMAMKPPIYPVLDMLLEREIITPGTQTHLTPTYDDLHYKECRILSGIDGNHTVWQHFLVKQFYEWLGDGNFDAGDQFVGIAERLLRRGADPRFRFETLIIQFPDETRAAPITEDSFFFGDPSVSEPMRLRRKCQPFFSVSRQIDQDPNTPPFRDLFPEFLKIRTWRCDPTRPNYEISFTEWVQSMDHFAGKEGLLQLLEDKIRERQGDDMERSAATSEVLKDHDLDSLPSTEIAARPTHSHHNLTASRGPMSPLNQVWWLYLISIVLGRWTLKDAAFLST